MSINYMDYAVELARRQFARTHDFCARCREKIPVGGDLFCVACREADQPFADERMYRGLVDTYRYTRTECLGCHVGQASPEEPYCVSCRFKREQFAKATAEKEHAS